jgi:hypothetical protein
VLGPLDGSPLAMPVIATATTTVIVLAMTDAAGDTGRAMSQENLELMRRGYEHFGSTGDFLVEIMHPDFVWNMSTFRGWPERQTYSGIDGLREFNSDWTGAREDWDLR